MTKTKSNFVKNESKIIDAEYEIIEKVAPVNVYEIRKELMEFYIDFLIKNEILFAESLDDLKGKFEWTRFQAFTQSVSHGAAPFSSINGDTEG